MNNDVEKLLRSFEGSEPSPQTSQAIFAAARRQAQQNALRSRRSRIVRRIAIAAAACILIGIAASTLMPSGKPATAGSVVSERLPVVRDGEHLTLHRDDPIYMGDILLPEVRSDIVLADGSNVRLDADANLTLATPGEDTRVRLELKSGKIFARVASAPGEFIVAGTGEIRVVGTAFGVEQHTNRMQTSVIDGTVILSAGGDILKLKRGETGAVREGAAPHKTGDDPNIKTATVSHSRRKRETFASA